MWQGSNGSKLTNIIKILVLPIFTISSLWACSAPQNNTAPLSNDLIVGAAKLEEYLPLLEGQQVGLVVNQTSVVGSTHLVDTLLARGVKVVKIFSPEHGFRGDAPDGETVKDGIDIKTQLPLVSLYGKVKKPTPEQLEGVDIIIFDIQDVGARFYTFISTMHYVMEACAENDKSIIILDRPNPNGHYVAGPVREEEQKSFVGYHPIPIVHGLTIGELAQMINGEGWLAGELTTNVTVIDVDGYDHKTRYSLPVKPSPNLPNDLAINLYPSLCLFEGTKISVGRGTTYPFQVIGYPDSTFGDFNFTPISIPNMSKYPPHENQECYGVDFREEDIDQQFTLKYLLEFYSKADFKDEFFNNYINRLVGYSNFVDQVRSGMTEQEITATWQADIKAYKKIRKKYLLYPDFE